jgi:hypothetical protein
MKTLKRGTRKRVYLRLSVVRAAPTLARLQYHGPFSNKLGSSGKSELIGTELCAESQDAFLQKYDSFDTSATYPFHNRGHNQSATSNGGVQHTQCVTSMRFPWFLF